MSRPLAWLAAVIVALGWLCMAYLPFALARDLDGRYAQSELKGWFDGLKSKGGSLCCSDADGRNVKDVDWDTQDGHYRVRLDGTWIVVPDAAVIDVPNRAGIAIVWPVFDGVSIKIRCFIPGTQS